MIYIFLLILNYIICYGFLKNEDILTKQERLILMVPFLMILLMLVVFLIIAKDIIMISYKNVKNKIIGEMYK